MKKKNTIFIAVLTVLLIMFFPIPVTRNISGNGEVLTLQKEKIGDCELEIEISEISSLAICYIKSFSFIINGKATTEFATTSHSEAGGISFLSQMYYDEEMDEMRLSSLIYSNDFTYAVLNLGENYYFINNGADITYDELPVS